MTQGQMYKKVEDFLKKHDKDWFDYEFQVFKKCEGLGENYVEINASYIDRAEQIFVTIFEDRRRSVQIDEIYTYKN